MRLHHVPMEIALYANLEHIATLILSAAMLQHPLCSQRHLLQSPQYPCQRLLHQPLALSLHPLPGTGTVLVEHVDAHTYPAGLERTPTQPIAILTQCSGKYIIGMMVHAPSQRE